MLAHNPTASLAEIEMTFRAAAGTAYIIAGEPFSVVIGFSNWHSALGRLGMTAEMSRAVLAGEPNTPARSGGRRQCAQSPPPIGGIAALGLQMRLFRHDAAAPKFARVFPVERGVERGVADRAPIKAAPQHLVFPAMLGPLLQAARRCNRLSLGFPSLKASAVVRTVL